MRNPQSGPSGLWILSYLFPVLALGLFFSSCLKERECAAVAEKEEASVYVAIVLPEPVSTTTRADRDEGDVAAIRILVFTANGEDYRFSYQVPESRITPIGNRKFKAMLRAENTPLKLMVLANVGGSLAGFDPAEGTPEIEIRRQIGIDFPAGGMTGNLPMYGETILPNGIGKGETHVTMRALRAVARVDVKLDPKGNFDNFVLEEVRVFRAYDRLRLIPHPVKNVETPVVTSVSIPDNAQFLSAPVIRTANGADSITNIYIPESHPAGGKISEADGTTVVVVGGRFGGSDRTTYYRADFDPGVKGHPFGQVLRNHRYIFNILSVSAAGWNTAEEAARNFATSIVVQIQAWEDFSSSLFFGKNRFAVSLREISLRFAQDRLKELLVESTLPYTIQWLDAGGNPVGQIASLQNETIANANFEAKILSHADDPETVTRLQFRTLRNNMAGTGFISDKLRVTVDNWSVDITVNQENASVYSDRMIHVLTGRDYTAPVGNLGSMVAYPDPKHGLAMRMILQNQFKPGGKIGIGGFLFDAIVDYYAFGGPSLTSASGDNLNGVIRLINAQDVIYLAYNAEESAPVGRAIIEWLNGSSRRVLIVGTDSGDSNGTVRNLLPNDGVWNYNISSDLFSRAKEIPEKTGKFFSGPFGDVGAVDDIPRNDNTMAYCAKPSSDVIPLITANYNGYMVLGVNRSRRIVYLGDADLFHTPQLSSNDGAVKSAPDILMANLWCWIVEQVIYGDE